MPQPCILLFETEVLVRSPLAEYLRECGYRVLEAATVAEAKQLLEEDSHRINVALADADAAGDAFSLAAWIRRACPGIKVIMAGNAARAAETAGGLCEEGPLVSRPYDHRIVLQRIRRLLAARDRAEGSD